MPCSRTGRVGAVVALGATLFAQTAFGQVVTTFQYDALGRLVRASEADGRMVVYKYDAAGNRLALGNGVAPGELLPRAFSASSNAAQADGLGLEAMRDLVFNTPNSSHVTLADGAAWIQADLGAAKPIDHLDLAPPDRAVTGGGVANLNDAQIQYSQDAFNWTNGPTASGAVAGIYKTIALGGVSARYVRVLKANASVGLGDFRLYATAKQANQAPVAVDDVRAKLNTGETTTLDPRQNDTDADHHELVITSVSPAAHGQTSFTGSSVTHIPDPGFKGTDTFTYTITDDRGGFATGAIALTYRQDSSVPDNRSPIATGDVAVTKAETPVTLHPLANDSDPDGDTLTIAAVTSPANGRAEILQDGSVLYTPNAGFTGEDRFDYTCSDGRGGTATATVIVAVTNQTGNNAPIARNDFSPTSPSSVPATIGAAMMVLSNDTDPDDDPITISAFSQPAHGALQRVTTYPEHLHYTPTQGYLGPDSFTYTISDGRGGTATATVYLNVVYWSNYTPRAGDDSYTVPNYRTSYLPVFLNDYDPNADVLQITATTPASHGSVAISGIHIPYTPTSGYLGSDSFTYTVSDGHGGSATATVSLTVTGRLNPVAVNDTVDARYNEAVSFDGLLSNDSDPNGDILSLVAVSQPSHGTTSLNSNAVLYTPTPGYMGPDSFTYTISDGEGGTATATVTVNVPIERFPIATNDTFAVGHDETTALPVLANDTDADNDPLTLQSVGAPAHGTVTIDNGQVLYTAAAGYRGPDSFTYTISDGRTGLATGTVTLSVQDVNHTPQAVADSYTLVPNLAKTLTPRGNDSDVDGDLLVITAVSTPAHGTASIASGGAAITYTPTANYTGSDAFTYTISDGRGGQATGQISLTIVGNRAPVPTNDVLRMSYGPTTPTQIIDVLANDSDPDGDALTLISVLPVFEDEPGGSAYVENGKVIFNKDADVGNGAVRFYYTVADSKGATSQGQLSITVNSVLFAQADNFTVQIGGQLSLMAAVLANDSSASGQPVTPSQFVAISGDPFGNVEYNSNAGTLTYTTRGTSPRADSFMYTIADNQGGGAMGTVTVNVVAAVSNNPPRTGPAYFEVTGGAATPLPQLLSRAFDPDGDPLTISVPTGQTKTKIVDGVLIYTPPPGAYGSDHFNYTLSDGRGGTTTGTANILIRYNVAPQAMDDTAIAQDGVATPMVVLANDTDFNSDPLTVIAIASPPAHGRVQIVDGKSLVYTATAGYGGPDALVYTISDGAGGSADATVSITVLNTPDTPPTANADGPVTVVHNTATTLNPRTNDSDANGDPLTIVAVGQPGHGGVVMNGAASVTYTPTAGYSGSDSFSYTIWDGRGGTASATVSLIVLPQANRAPTAANDSYTLVSNVAKTLTPRGNDSDLDGDILEITAVSSPAHGIVSIASGGAAVSYTPTANYTGSDAFTYTISDGRGGQATGQISLTLVGNRAPTPVQDVAYMSSGSEADHVTVYALSNDSDPDGDGLTLAGVQDSDEDFEAYIEGNAIKFRGLNGASGPKQIYYWVTDTKGATAYSYIKVNIGPVVFAQADTFTMQRGTSLSLLSDILANDSTVSGDPVTAGHFNTVSGQPSHGSVVYNGQTLIYTPQPNYVGADSFLYNLTDGQGGGATGTVTINVVAAVTNRPPRTGPATLEVRSGVSTPLPQLLSRASDPDGDPLTISVQAGQPRVKVVDGVVVYTPAAGAAGLDGFAYTISDGKGGTASGAARILIRYNTPPKAANDSHVAQAGVTTPITVLANDSDPDGDVLTVIAIASPPAHGRVQIVDGKSLVYTAANGYAGADSLTYTVSDGVGTAEATVTITVQP